MTARRMVHFAVAALVALAVTEIALRVAATGNGVFAAKLREWDPDTSTLQLVGSSCFRARPGNVLRYANGTTAHANALGYRGPEVSVPKPPATYRVVLLGGSTTHGFLVGDDDTIDAHLRRVLRVPGAARVEAVNLGLDSLDATCDRELLLAVGLGLQPDAVIVHTGINDVEALRLPALAANAPERGVRAQIRIGEEARRDARGPWRTVKHLLYGARLPGVLRLLLGRSAAPLDGPPEPEPTALDAFERTVRETVALVPPDTVVLLSTPPSGLGTDAPLGRPLVVDRATTQRYRDRLDERLRRVAADARAQGRDVRYVPHALPDDVFLDDCHLDGDGNRLLAEDFARALTAAPHAR
jgi:hypothetical protein